jgi:periplasmic protein CpxP/Spy
MKRQVLTFAFSAALGLTSLFAAPQSDSAQPPAQDAGGQQHGNWRRPDPKQQVKRMAKRLDLTSDQQTQLLPILQDRDTQMGNLRTDTSMSQDDRRGKMKSIREETDNKIRALLNDDQKKKYDEMQQQMRDRMRDHQAPPQQ